MSLAFSRRSFLKYSAVAAVAVAGASLFSGCESQGDSYNLLQEGAGSMTILQTRTRTDMMGRVFSLTSVISSGAMPLSMAVFGPLADYMSVQLQLIITGAAMIIISLVALRFREFVAIGAPAAAELQATPEQEHKEGAGTLPDATGRD